MTGGEILAYTFLAELILGYCLLWNIWLRE